MIRLWCAAIRPWSFTAALIPILLGTALALGNGFFNGVLWGLTLLGGICVQAGTNLMNGYRDYEVGVDTLESARGCTLLVTDQVKLAQMKLAARFAFFAATGIGLFLAYRSGWPILAVGVIGVMGGYGYTAGIYPYKYTGLGSVFVFFLMGPLMVWPSYYIQTEQYSWVPVFASLPIAFLVTAILHANDIRDFVYDRQAGIQTLALRLGFRGSLILYRLLHISAYVSLMGLLWFGIVPWTAGIAFCCLPRTIVVLRYIPTGVKMPLMDGQRLVKGSAGFHFVFGLLFAGGIALYPWIETWLIPMR